jgi:broad specificity phosphatase PhoE
MAQVILVRHGEVAGNTGEKTALVGWGDLPLTARGETQSRAVAEYLSGEKIAAVYSSDLQRARLTAERIAEKHGLEVRVHRDLREVNYGAWESLSEAEITAGWPELWPARQNDPWNVAAPEGENYEQMWTRFFPQWQRIIESHAGETAVFVGHNGLIRMLICHLLGAPFENFRRVHINNCSVSRVEIGAEKVLVRCLNDTSFLKELGLMQSPPLAPPGGRGTSTPPPSGEVGWGRPA